MTTLMRHRTHKWHGEHSVTTLAVTGDAGSVCAALAAGVPLSPQVCSPAGEPHELLHEDCPIRGGRCYGDTIGGDAGHRVRSAWAAGEGAVYAALEELYHTEFGA